MKLGILFSGGKDSGLALFLAKKQGYKISCLISIVSENKYSYMFHTPLIQRVEKQAEVMGIPLIIKKTKGEKEKELKDLEIAIRKAKKEYKIGGIITGAVESVYQASRVQKICNKLNLECFNPLWQKDQFELLDDLIKNKFEVIVAGVSAYPLDENFLGRKVDKNFVVEMRKLWERFKINPAGEGGEFESFVLNCSMFKRGLKMIGKEISGRENSWSLEGDVE
ncbi:diphthine--ammonia ligase [Candidatus Pacearchaeota archaeon]|nr:diphthine--ammonia ligase [Candidatus Pacearchaeota archaeon]